MDLSTAGQLMERLAGDLRDGGDLTLEIEEVSFMDSAGLHAIISVAKSIGGRGTLRLLAPSAQVLKLLQVTAVERWPGVRVETSPSRGEHRGERRGGHRGERHQEGARLDPRPGLDASLRTSA